MSPIEAYERLCKFLKRRVKIVLCREYRNFYGFYFTDKKASGRVYVGGAMMLVQKKTGDVLSEDDLPKPISGKEEWVDVPSTIFKG